MADVLGGILTNGLGGDCTAMILGPFRLKIFIEVTGDDGGGRPGGTGGGSIPVDTDNSIDNTIDNYRDEDRQKRVNIMIKMGENTIERDYIVTEKRSEQIVKVANLINKTLEKMRVTVSNFKKKAGSIKARFVSKDIDE